MKVGSSIGRDVGCVSYSREFNQKFPSKKTCGKSQRGRFLYCQDSLLASMPPLPSSVFLMLAMSSSACHVFLLLAVPSLCQLCISSASHVFILLAVYFLCQSCIYSANCVFLLLIMYFFIQSCISSASCVFLPLIKYFFC